MRGNPDVARGAALAGRDSPAAMARFKRGYSRRGVRTRSPFRPYVSVSAVRGCYAHGEDSLLDPSAGTAESPVNAPPIRSASGFPVGSDMLQQGVTAETLGDAASGLTSTNETLRDAFHAFRKLYTPAVEGSIPFAPTSISAGRRHFMVCYDVLFWPKKSPVSLEG